jgi:hypothetical protein
MDSDEVKYVYNTVQFLQSNNTTPPTTTNGFANQLTVKLPSTIDLQNAEVALTSLYCYNSWSNIAAAFSNNTLAYQVPTSTTTWSTSYPIYTNTATPTYITDGAYSIDNLNSVIAYTMKQNGHYFLDSSSNEVYPLKIQVSTTGYAVALTCLLITSPWTNGYTYPSSTAPNKFTSANTYTGTICRLVVPATSIAAGSYTPGQSSMAKILGFAPGNYPSGNPGTYTQDQVFTGTVPQVAVVNSVNVGCNLVNEAATTALGASVIYTFSTNVSIGQQVQIIPQNLQWIPVTSGKYNDISITLLTDYFTPLGIIDPAITASLRIRRKKGASRREITLESLKRARFE